MILRIILTGLLFIASPLSWAGLSCITTNFQSDGDALLLNTDHSSDGSHLFLLTNKSNQDFLLNHEQKKESMNAGWMSALGARKASVIVVNQARFSLICGTLTPQKFMRIQCQAVLLACELNQAHLPAELSKGGNFWVVENVEKSSVVSALAARKITV